MAWSRQLHHVLTTNNEIINTRYEVEIGCIEKTNSRYESIVQYQ